MYTITRKEGTVKVIKTAEQARKFILWLDKQKQIAGLDFETTALRPDEYRDARVRLTSISTKAGVSYILDHDYCGAFEKYADALLECGVYYVFNVNFEGKWFGHHASSVTALSRRLLDVGHMKRSVKGGGPLWLKTMVKYDLKEDMDKELQNSDWSVKNLSDDQYFYAGLDAERTKRLGDLWSDQMTPSHWNGFYVVNEAWRAVNECQDTGQLIDERHHKKLIRMWERRKKAAEATFRKYVSTNDIPNIRSKKQISDFLKRVLDDEAIAMWPKTEKTAQLQTSRDILRTMSFNAPYPFSRMLASLMVYNKADKYLGTYGETLLNIQQLSYDGRIHSRLNMAQAITGRFSSSGPNQQNYPRHPAFRFSFIAGEGFKLILADYSGVEIRVLAEVSGDAILLHDAIYDDVHARSAIAIYQVKDEKEFLRILKHDPEKDKPLTAREKSLKAQYKEMRAKAKGFTFQLLYGAGAAALAIVLRCTVDEAQDAINKWAARYKKAFHYRQIMFEQMMHTGYMPTASGRTIFVPKHERSMPVAANYPIQGSAGDVMYAAMRHTQLLLEELDLDAAIQASVHDEMLLLSEEWCAEIAREALEEGMIRGWLEIFPGSNTDNLVDAVVGDRWSDKA